MLEGLVIEMNIPDSDHTQTLLSVQNKNSVERFTLYRDILGFNNDLTGVISFSSLDDSFIHSSEYIDGVNIKDKNTMTLSGSKEWNCTFEEFGFSCNCL